jgi:hypothetical protein
LFVVVLAPVRASPPPAHHLELVGVCADCV